MAAVRRLMGNEHLSVEFATRWPEYDLDPKTRTLLSYAKKLTAQSHLIDDPDIDAMREAGWDDAGIYEATALISLYNFTGRMDAASGLPQDEPSQDAQYPEAVAP